MFRMKPSKGPDGTFPPKHPPCAHGLSATPTNRTLVRIEVFFTPGDPEQKTDLKSPLRRQTTIFSTKLDGTEMFRLWF